MNYEALVKAVYPEAECIMYPDNRDGMQRGIRTGLELPNKLWIGWSNDCKNAWQSAYNNLTEQQKQKAQEKP